jgi:hypothetical protein
MLEGPSGGGKKKMYLLFTDETNQQPSDSISFFIYGGIVIKDEALIPISDGIDSIRVKYGFSKSDDFKFDTRTRPENITIDSFSKAKCELVELCIKNKVCFITYVIHHEIQKNQELDQKLEWAADYVIGRFNIFLEEHNDYGLCIIDNLPTKSQYKYLSRKFVIGNNVEGCIKPLNKIKLFATTCSNASNYSSAMDIILGCFRYCINDPKNISIAKTMMNNVVGMMWGKHENGVHSVIKRGLIFRPEIDDIKSSRLKTEYQALLSRLNDLLKEE